MINGATLHVEHENGDSVIPVEVPVNAVEEEVKRHLHRIFVHQRGLKQSFHLVLSVKLVKEEESTL